MKDHAELQLQAFIMAQNYGFEVGTPTVDTTVDNALFLTEMAYKLEEVYQQLDAWTKWQSKKKKRK